MKLTFGFMSRWWMMMVAVMAITHSAQALVIYGGAAGQTSDPGDGLPWDYVGNTGVYLGAYDTGYWVITANHVGAGGITLGGNFYSSVGGSAQQIGTTDLLLYRINVSTHGAPELENLNISVNTPLPGQPVVMVADGSGVMTWGTNTVEGYGNYSLTQGGPQTVGLITTYSPITGEAQGQSGDSGGALFYQQLDGSWLLSGILSGIGTNEGTQFTASVAVAAYYADIVAIVGTALAPIPEPASAAVLAGGVVLVAGGFVRRRRG